MSAYTSGIQYLHSHNLFKKIGKNAVHLFAMETPPCPAHQIRFFSGINLIPGAYLDNYNFQKNNRTFKN